MRLETIVSQWRHNNNYSHQWIRIMCRLNDVWLFFCFRFAPSRYNNMYHFVFSDVSAGRLRPSVMFFQNYQSLPLRAIINCNVQNLLEQWGFFPVAWTYYALYTIFSTMVVISFCTTLDRAASTSLRDVLLSLNRPTIIILYKFFALRICMIMLLPRAVRKYSFAHNLFGRNIVIFFHCFCFHFFFLLQWEFYTHIRIANRVGRRRMVIYIYKNK